MSEIEGGKIPPANTNENPGRNEAGFFAKLRQHKSKDEVASDRLKTSKTNSAYGSGVKEKESLPTRQRGRPKLENPKIRISMMIDPEVLEHYKSVSDEFDVKYQTLANWKLRLGLPGGPHEKLLAKIAEKMRDGDPVDLFVDLLEKQLIKEVGFAGEEVSIEFQETEDLPLDPDDPSTQFLQFGDQSVPVQFRMKYGVRYWVEQLNEEDSATPKDGARVFEIDDSGIVYGYESLDAFFENFNPVKFNSNLVPNNPAVQYFKLESEFIPVQYEFEYNIGFWIEREDSDGSPMKDGQARMFVYEEDNASWKLYPTRGDLLGAHQEAVDQYIVELRRLADLKK